MILATRSPVEWAQTITDNFITLSVCETPEDFRASLRRCELGSGVTVTAVDAEASRVVRTERGIRCDASNDLLLLMPVAGQATIRQDGHEGVVGTDAVTVHVANVPYELVFDGPGRVIVMQAPMRLVPTASLVAPERRRALDGTGLGAAAVFRAFVAEVMRVSDSLSPKERDELGSTAAELALTVLGSCTGDLAEGAASRKTVMLRAQAFIRDNLWDPDLSPLVVAEQQRVSLRYLQGAFAAGGASPAAYIRSERLRLARRMLGDPRYSTLSVAQVGLRVGFTDTNVFIRAFRREHRLTPGAWRHEQRERPLA
ncbi:AraC family transcriptional regulator [Streptomyces tanashiensis]|uniref:AraC family transcriptional regulator n=1 Tax=Streptomyces tanashiensis TaxID=67367 RepID=UPI0036E26E1F